MVLFVCPVLAVCFSCLFELFVSCLFSLVLLLFVSVNRCVCFVLLVVVLFVCLVARQAGVSPRWPLSFGFCSPLFLFACSSLALVLVAVIP